MSIFEKPFQNKVISDDTEKLVCTVENAQNINNHTEYILRVQRDVNKEKKWMVSHRYRDFAALHASLQQANIELPLPPKKLIGNMQPSFIAERQIALQNYINELLKHQVLALSLQVRSFLEPLNYPFDITEVAVQTVSIALRGDGRYELRGPLPDIGWRIHKHYFLVTEIESKTNCMLSWQNYGPDRYLGDKDLQAAFKSIENMYHPHIDQILGIHNLETGAYVVRRIHEKGTVKDMLYGTEYNKSHLAKYGNPKVRKPFTMGQIAHYGYHILQAMKFLQDKGIPHGHIHPGNIAIENQKALLLDIENVLLGVPCVHRPYLLELKHSTIPEAVDVYCFGRTLYEMALAAPLEHYYCDFYPENICEDLESILRMCISSTSCKHGPPLMDSLLYHPFFTRATLGRFSPAPADPVRPHLKFPLTLKEELGNALRVAETRLRNEQKLVRRAKRDVRIQEILNSEEEMKKHKRRMKKRESVWKSSSSLAETVRSHSATASTASSPTRTPPRHDNTGAPGTPAASNNNLTNGNENGAETSDHSSPAGGTCTGAGAGRGYGEGEGSARSALLDAICSFDRRRLSKPPRAHRATVA